jgi:hypothetical protein
VSSGRKVTEAVIWRNRARICAWICSSDSGSVVDDDAALSLVQNVSCTEAWIHKATHSGAVFSLSVLFVDLDLDALTIWT